jgi:hypothetical protein
MVHSKVNLLFETVDKNLHILNVKRVVQLNTLFAVVLVFVLLPWGLAVIV